MGYKKRWWASVPCRGPLRGRGRVRKNSKVGYEGGLEGQHMARHVTHPPRMAEAATSHWM